MVADGERPRTADQFGSSLFVPAFASCAASPNCGCSIASSGSEFAKLLQRAEFQPALLAQARPPHEIERRRRQRGQKGRHRVGIKQALVERIPENAVRARQFIGPRRLHRNVECRDQESENDDMGRQRGVDGGLRTYGMDPGAQTLERSALELADGRPQIARGALRDLRTRRRDADGCAPCAGGGFARRPSQARRCP